MLIYYWFFAIINDIINSIGIPFIAFLVSLQLLLILCCRNDIPLAIGSLSIIIYLIGSFATSNDSNVFPLVPFYLSLILPMELQWFKLVSYESAVLSVQFLYFLDSFHILIYHLDAHSCFLA